MLTIVRIGIGIPIFLVVMFVAEAFEEQIVMALGVGAILGIWCLFGWAIGSAFI